jgi:tRNA(fMet)-specific endonuclease VapC
MTGSFVLDTNIIIAFFKDDVAVLEHLKDADELFVPAVVLGELRYGARKSGRARANLDRIDAFETVVSVLPVNAATAQHYGVIKEALHTRGRPLPENDIWIAAVASQHGLTVVSRDEHFREVDGLEHVRW